MTIRNPKIRIGVLFLLVLLPVFFPFAYRKYYLIPFDTGSAAGNTELIVLLFAIYFLIALPYWFFVGYTFARTTHSFGKSFLLGNIPIFFNTIGEIIYFHILGLSQNTYPIIEYLIGSHIDKFNILGILSIESPVISILVSAICFLSSFSLGYIIRKKGLRNFILLR